MTNNGEGITTRTAETSGGLTGKEKGGAKGRPAAAQKDRGKKILVVDDEETVGIGMSEILKDAGFDALYVTSGAAALDEVRKTTYSLVFMDMVMPGLDGLATFRNIKKLDPSARVVLFTGYFKDADRSIFQGVMEGMIDEYIRKPFFADEIVNTAKKYA